MLIGYIPVTKLEHMPNKTARRRALANLYHSCMGKLLEPIRACGETGLAMLSGDGTWHHCHSIFATFVDDYPEQTLVTCTLNGHCLKCLAPPNQLGDHCNFPAWNYVETIDIYNLANKIHATFMPPVTQMVSNPFVNHFGIGSHLSMSLCPLPQISFIKFFRV